MLEVDLQSERWLTLRFNSWEKVVYKPFFYKRLNQLKQAKSLEELETLFDKMESDRAYSYLVYLLARRSYTSSELKSKLTDRAISESSIASAFARIEHYLNDDEVILAYLRKELRKGYGPRIIIPKVSHRLKMPNATVYSLYNDISDEEIELAKEKLLTKKKGKDPRQVLYQRGF